MTGRLTGTHKDRGSAVVDFALVGGLLTLLFAAVLQLGIALYVHKVLVSCAGEGARTRPARIGTPGCGGASSTRGPDAHLRRYAHDVTADEEMVGGVRAVVVRVRAPLPLFGLFGRPGSCRRPGTHFAERQ